MTEISVIPITGIPEIGAGDDVAELLCSAAGAVLAGGDVVVVTHKIVSKAEGRIVEGPKGDAVAGESVRVLRRSGSMVIAETRHGFVCANAGVDESNVAEGTVALLPVDPDASARRIRARIARIAGIDAAVIISDTFGRPWRLGQTDVAVGVAGIEPFLDYRGTVDAGGRPVTATRIAIADEIAAAAEMVMGKADGIPAAIVRGAPVRFGRGAAADIVRPPSQDLFR